MSLPTITEGDPVVVHHSLTGYVESVMDSPTGETIYDIIVHPDSYLYKRVAALDEHIVKLATPDDFLNSWNE